MQPASIYAAYLHVCMPPGKKKITPSTNQCGFPSSFILNAPDGHKATCAISSAEDAFSIFIQGRSLGW
jgi:hypothetical protein